MLTGLRSDDRLWIVSVLRQTISLFAAELFIHLWTGLLRLKKAGRPVLFLFEGPSSNSAYTAQNDKLPVSNEVERA